MCRLPKPRVRRHPDAGVAGGTAGHALHLLLRQPENIRLVLERFPNSTVHYDGYVDEEKVSSVKAMVGDNQLIVWLALPSELTTWVKVPMATPELCAMVKKYGKLGLWILETQEQLEQAEALGADLIETTGAVKPR